MYDNNQQNKA